MRPADPTGYGRLLLQGDRLSAIREERDASETERKIGFVNGGVMALSGAKALESLDAIEDRNDQKEFYLTDAVEIADAIRGMAMKGELIRRSTGEKQTGVTVSIGVAALHDRALPQSLLEAADLCLRAAKRSGRNCVIGENDERLVATLAG